MTKRILIADDEPAVRQLLELVLRSQGYEVVTTQNGDQLVRTAQEWIPDLVIIDLMMPQMDGYEAIRQLRNDTRTAHVPMLILTARSTAEDVVTGFDTGADDYVTKPFNIPELLARIRAHLRRAAQTPVHNPLTGLAGNVLLTEELKYRLKNDTPFALLYVDLDNFKAFNDTYGPARGDRLIKLVAGVLTDVIQEKGAASDFIGHIGGDDFAVLTSPERLDEICQSIIALFDMRVRDLYDPEDLARGYLRGVDRQGVPRNFPITTISIGVVTNCRRHFTDYEEISRVAAEMKQYAKQLPGSTYAVDSRSTNEQVVERDRRGVSLPPVLIVSADVMLRSAIVPMIDEADLRALDAPTVLDAERLLAYHPETALVIVDMRMGKQLCEFCHNLATHQPKLPIIALADKDSSGVVAPGTVRHILSLPLDQEQLHAKIVEVRSPSQKAS
ncbi:MAG: response regulator [Roseiflexus sp.]|jgi:DNA-binding response OmpR family regulator|nr:response regulator [Roseiflexus sp.]MBO9336683.1 response regulator [Roseiflexus sp.]MBO9365507.1 response regulator [Roseiflexus sp.]MBO9381620.1 response regulator [Roseiflexus sp.]MBO9390113.1 response regulator [Roseiflexus sp.]